ncbi:MAG TPA: DUF3160 domain-containing protein [Polyangiaceae bacterium]|jgi:hypothetical protein
MPAIALTLAVALGCGAGAAHSKPPADPGPPAVTSEQALPKVPTVPVWTYWQPVEAPLPGASTATMDLPVSEAVLARTPTVAQRWDAMADSAREAILTRGFAVLRAARPEVRLGDFYAALEADHVPSVLTLDALFFLAHLAFDRALADVDALVVTPLVATMLHDLDARVAAESRGAPADMVPAYAAARSLVAVALSLGEPTYVPPATAARAVEMEKALVFAHAGIAASPALGVPIDYAAMAPGGAAAGDSGRAPWFRAVAWLENAWLALEGRGERNAQTRVDVATARAHTRAALILSRALDAAVDSEAANAWERIERLSTLLVGPSDGVSPRDLAATVSTTELDPRRRDWLADVGAVDRVRHRAARGRVIPAFRLFGLRAVPDVEVLQALTSPAIGPSDLADATMTWAPYEHAEPAFTGRDGIRALPRGLDVAAWLGSAEAREALRDSGDDAYEGYDDALALLRQARPPDVTPTSPGRHGTPYLSMLDAIETWLRPSAGDACHPAAMTSDWRKRKADVALAAWTELRHDATALTRIPLEPATLPARLPGDTATPAFVEAHPEAISKLSGFVRQLSRALSAEGWLPPDAPALQLLDEVDDLLWTALGAAVYESADAPMPDALAAALSGFPARLRGLEAALAESKSVDVPIIVAVHVDVPSGRVLEEATGRIAEAWVVVREPGTHRAWLALGASIPHHELVQPTARRLDDGAWRARLASGAEPGPGALARWYVDP